VRSTGANSPEISERLYNVDVTPKVDSFRAPGGMVILCITGLAMLLAACQKEVPAKRYALRGEVMALDPQARTATIKHEKIGDGRLLRWCCDRGSRD